MTTSTARARYDAHAAKLQRMPIADLLAMATITDRRVDELRAEAARTGDYTAAQALNMARASIATAIEDRHPQIIPLLEQWVEDDTDARTYTQALTHAVLACGIITQRRLDAAVTAMTAAAHQIGLLP